MKMDCGRVNNILCGPKVEASFSRDGIGSFIFQNAMKHANKICQVSVKTGKEETYEDVNRRTIYAALRMRQQGVKRNDVIALCSSNNLDSIVVLGATFYLGAIFSSLDSKISSDKIVNFLDMTAPKIIFVGAESLEVIASVVKGLKFDVEVVVLDEDSFGHTSFAEFQRPIDDWESFAPVAVLDDAETAFMLSSSGTSGVSKCICVSHYAMLRFSENDISMGWKTDVILDSLWSLYWTVGIALTLESFWTGGRLVMWDNFNPETVAKVIQEYKVTMAFVNSAFMKLLTEENTLRCDTSSLHTIQAGASKLSAEILAEVKTYFPTSIVALGYGMTEAGVITSFSRITDTELICQKPGSCGKVVPNTKIKIVDILGGATLGPNEMGELRVKTDGIFNKYYNFDTSEYFDSDGWFKTGDIGYYDDDDCVFICDRLKEVYKYQDWHVFPTHLEKVLHQHPSVKEAIVIGVPRALDGEHGLALVVPKGKGAGNDTILTFVNDRVADYEKLRAGVIFVDDLPKTSLGKFKRNMIRDMYLNGDIYN